MASIFSRLFGAARPEYFLAIDIGSNTALRSLRAELRDGELRITAKDAFELLAREDESALISAISGELRALFFRHVRELGRVPSSTLIGLGNHFTVNEMAVPGQERQRPREPLRESEIRSLLSQFHRTHAAKTSRGRTYALVHVMPFRVLIDGYPVTVLTAETRGRRLEVALAATYALDAYWRMLSNLRSFLGGLSLRFMANQTAIAAAVVRHLKASDALLVKVGARITEITLLGDGIVLRTGQFNSGGDGISAAIAQRLGISQTEAERIKRQWDETILPGPSRAAAASAIAQAVGRWRDELVGFLHAEERFSLPERVLLLGGGAKLAALGQALAAEPWWRDLTFLDAVSVQTLDAAAIAAKVFGNTAPRLGGPEEVALASIAARILHSHNQPQP